MTRLRAPVPRTLRVGSGERGCRRDRFRSGAPSAARARSVWSRVGAGSATVVSPSAATPASRTALLTCALGTFGTYAMACRAPPCDFHRRVPLVGLDERAPSSAADRRRVPSDGATGSRPRRGPPRTGLPRQHPREQPHRRTGVAAVQRHSAGAMSPPRPSPSTSSGGSDRYHGFPRSTWNRHPPPARQPSERRRRGEVEPCPEELPGTPPSTRTSSDRGSPTRRLRPSAVAARISQRWAIDLSPGTTAVAARGSLWARRGRPSCSGQPDRVVAAGRQHGGAGGRGAGGDGEVHGSPAALRRVHDLQVLDVDPPLARAPP